MTPPTLRQLAATLRRRAAEQAQSLPNEWTTAAGDHAETYRANTTPGAPQRYGWRVTARNGEKVAAGGEQFTRRRSARRAMNRVFPYPGQTS